ncbi:choloylglycine hydrolase [Alteromonadaceae bacterium 2753L.S.0a.02]|nr:choloylglycine hydrolase [Alteromonadaceae bacterium 2753L.S.0a.02]
MINVKQSKLAQAVIAVSTAAMLATSTANACTRYITKTDHGTLVMRSADWAERLTAVAKVYPVNQQRESLGAQNYAKPASWTVKYHTVTIEEPLLFHNLAAEAMNDQGLSAQALYMGDSKPYTELHKDTGAPAVNQSDIVTFLAEKYATVAEVVAAHKAGEFQIAWADEMRNSGARHGLHYSVVDKSGAIALFQLNEGGVEKVWTGDSEGELRVMTNSPLQQYHVEYVKNFDLDNKPYGDNVPASISSLDRNLRMLWGSMHQNYSGLSYDETKARQQQVFDASVVVPHGIQDPSDNGSGSTYATWLTFQYNLDNGEFITRNLQTAKSITFNIDDTKSFTEVKCAKIVEQADANASEVSWGNCSQ